MRIFVAALLVLLLGALTWLVVGTGEGAPQSAPFVEPGTLDETTHDQTGQAEVATDHGPGETPRTVVDREPAADEDGADGDEALDTAKVRVVLAADGTPVPDADVLYLAQQIVWDEMSPAEQSELQLLQLDQERYLTKFGRRTRSDADGYAVVRFEKGRSQLAARKGELYGESSINMRRVSDEDWTIELEPDLGFDVEVIGPNGSTVAGIPVVASFRTFDRWFTKFRDRQLTIGVTDDAGRTSARHVQAWGARSEDGNRRLLLGASVHGLDPERVAVDLDALPSDPIRLKALASGSVFVSAVDLAGKPVGTFWAHLERLENGKVQQPQFGNSGQAMVRTDDGVRFRHVALGHQWQITAWFGSYEATDTLAGPVNPEQEVRFVLRQDPSSTILTGRAVDETGVGFSKRGLVVEIESTGEQRLHFWSYATTDDNGDFRMLLEEPTTEPCSLKFRMVEGNDWNRGRMSEVIAAGGIPIGRNDIGNLVFAPLPQVVAGHLRVADGDRIVGASVSVQRLLPPSERSPGMDGWRDVDGLSASVEADGRFAISGKAPNARLRLRVQSGRHLPVDPVDFALGADDVEIDVALGGSMVASVLHDETVPAQNLRLELHRQHTPPTNVVEASFAPWPRPRTVGELWRSEAGESTFQWQGLEPGTYRLELRPQSTEAATLTVDGIVVRASETTDDPRLKPIDLRAALRSFRVRVLYPSGEPIGNRGATVVVENRDPTATGVGRPLRGGETVLVTSEPSVNLLVIAPRHPIRELRGVRGDVEVTLDPGLDLELRISVPELPEDSMLKFVLTKITTHAADSRTYRRERGRDETLKVTDRRPITIRRVQNGTKTIKVADAGTYRIDATLHLEDGSSKTVRDLQPGSIEVATSAERQVFELTISKDALTKALFGRDTNDK